MAAEVPLRRRFDEPLRLARLPAVPAPDERLVVEEVDGALDEDGPGNPLAARREGPLERRDEVADRLHGDGPLHDRLHERELVDVLQRAASPEDRRRRPAEEDERRLREARVLERGDRVRHPGARRHRRDAGNAGEPGDRVGGEDRRGLVARVDDAEAPRLRRREDRGDVPAAEGEEELHPVADEDLGNELPARRHRRPPVGRTPFGFGIGTPSGEVSSALSRRPKGRGRPGFGGALGSVRRRR